MVGIKEINKKIEEKEKLLGQTEKELDDLYEERSKLLRASYNPSKYIGKFFKITDDDYVKIERIEFVGGNFNCHIFGIRVYASNWMFRIDNFTFYEQIENLEEISKEEYMKLYNLALKELWIEGSESIK